MPVVFNVDVSIFTSRSVNKISKNICLGVLLAFALCFSIAFALSSGGSFTLIIKYPMGCQSLVLE